MSSEIRGRVIQIISSLSESKSGVTADQITLQTDLVKQLGLDSLDVVDLIMRLEGEFKIEISDSTASKMKVVGDIVSYIQTVLDGEEVDSEDS